MKVKCFAAVFLLAFVYKAECVITGWTEPSITGADGSGSATDPVSEDATAGATTITIVATTGTAYTITSQTPTTPGTFAVANDGTISFTGTLDYETATEYVLVIEATDSSSATGTASVTVSITDVNDNDPDFGATTMGVCMDDGAAADTAVISLTATDADGTDNTISSYAITVAGNTGTDFAVSAAGAITVVNALDKTRTAGYVLEVEAEDSGTPVGTGTTTVFIAVTTPSSDAVSIVSGMAVTAIALLVARLV